MPLYDCGAPDCEECQRAFGPDRSKAIANYEARDQRYRDSARCLTPEENSMIDAAWEKHKAAAPIQSLEEQMIDGVVPVSKTEAEKDFERALSKPDECPYCGTPISQDEWDNEICWTCRPPKRELTQEEVDASDALAGPPYKKGATA